MNSNDSDDESNLSIDSDVAFAFVNFDGVDFDHDHDKNENDEEEDKKQKVTPSTNNGRKESLNKANKHAPVDSNKNPQTDQSIQITHQGDNTTLESQKNMMDKLLLDGCKSLSVGDEKIYNDKISTTIQQSKSKQKSKQGACNFHEN